MVFNSYGGRRSRWRPPGWLVLLLCGTVAGAGGVVVLQERYLPPRLSATATTQLRSSFEQADDERQRLKGELGEALKRLESQRTERARLADELATSRSTAERLRDDLASVVTSFPPDPRGGVVEVRSGQFTAKGGALSYNVVLMRERANGKTMPGVMQMVVAGESERGAQTTVALKPIALSIGSHEIVRGSAPLPDGFRPRQTTVQVLDRVAGKPLGMRVMLVK